jgi:flagellin
LNSEDNFSLFAISDETLNIKTLDLDDPNLIKKIDDAIDAVSIQRGQIGAKINRYEHKIDNQQTLKTNTETSRMRIEDLDMSTALSGFTKADIQMNTVQRMLQVNLSHFEQKMNLLYS